MNSSVLGLAIATVLATTIAAAPALSNASPQKTMTQATFPATPPLIAAPTDAQPVIVTVELIAKDPTTLEKHLNSAGVIPTTRLASGINYSWTVRDQNNPERFVLIQQWNSVEQQQGYIAWRVERGDLAELRSLLTQDPVVNYLSPIDLSRLPTQAQHL